MCVCKKKGGGGGQLFFGNSLQLCVEFKKSLFVWEKSGGTGGCIESKTHAVFRGNGLFCIIYSLFLWGGGGGGKKGGGLCVTDAAVDIIVVVVVDVVVVYVAVVDIVLAAAVKTFHRV